MTRNAADSGIRAVKALTVGETVGLEADGQLAAPVISHNRLPGAMTLAAEIRDIFRRPLAEVRGSGVEIAVERVAEVDGRASVTMLAGHARPERVVSHLTVCNRVAGVTAETHFGFA